MPFEYPDIETKPVKEPKGPRMITRKIRFQKGACTNEGWLIVTAERVARTHDGYVLNYKIRSCIDMSYIKFRCPEDKWVRLHAEFLGDTNSYIEKVRCSRL